MESKQRSGYFIDSTMGFKTFVPSSLPPNPPVQYDPELHSLLSLADRRLGRLDGITQILPNPELFVAMYVKKEALLMGTDAASGWVLDELEDGKPAPASSTLSDAASEAPKNSIVSYLVLDMDSYAERYGKKAVRKNITIPAYMNAYIEDNGLSLSEITQNAIEQLIQEN